MPIDQNIRLTVDAVIFSDSFSHVLLVQRKNPPFQGQWVFPGGFVDNGESLEAAAMRELEEETGLQVDDLCQLLAFGDPDRDPRGHTVTVAFLGVVDRAEATVKAASDAQAAKWFPLDDLPTLGFDHANILAEAMAFLREQ